MAGSSGDKEKHGRALATAVDALLLRLDAHAAGKPFLPKEAPDKGTALGTVCTCFGLTGFERDLLVLTAAMEIEPTTAARCAAASGDPARAYPTFSLALAALPKPHWGALTPVGPLRRWRLIEVVDSQSLTTSRLHIDERILHFLAGVSYLDTRLRGIARPIKLPDELPPSQEKLAADVAAGWRNGRRPHVDLVGTDRQTRREIVAVAASRAGLVLYTMNGGDLPTEPTDRDVLSQLWEREAVLLPAALLVELTNSDNASAIDTFVASLNVPVVISSDDAPPLAAETRERLSTSWPTQAEQQQLWARALNGTASLADHQLKDLVAQFSLPVHVIRSAGAHVRRHAHHSKNIAELAWRAGLTEARVALDELGQRIEPRAKPEDLVLPDQQRAVLTEIVAHVRQRGKVYQDWGFDAVLRRGLGVTALFSGTSGTGKTLAAEVVAGELGLDLFVIDLAQVTSKYIGETEKNLRRVFDAAERGGAVLLFDEADALFGKRSEIKDSHDRYANLEVSYLLMRMESYRGLAILTTNMKKALDSAFLRRIRFVVDFPFPAATERARIWTRVLPERVPVQELDMDRLAQLTVPGGAIRNIALSAAFLAADEGTSLQMRHMLTAARTEYTKLERSLTPGEIAGWV